MNYTRIRIAAVLLAVASLGWVIFIFASEILQTDWESTPQLLVFGAILLFVTPVAFLAQLIVLRVLVRKTEHTFRETATIRALLLTMGPIGASVAIFREARRLEEAGINLPGALNQAGRPR